MIGQTVSHYRVVDLLGAGGMGVVYKAEDARLRRAVALKFLPPELTLDVDAKQRLIHEAQAASALDHPNICTIYEIDETSDGRLFVAMAYYPGETLKQRLARGPLSIDEALSILRHIAGGVAAAHDAGIVHRDIKPANVMLTTSGEVKLVDFGLAKLPGRTMLTRTGTTVGTIAYMAPEQVAGLEADARTDVWALGIVLYEMLTGALPFTATNEAALLNAILHDSPRPVSDSRPELDGVLQALVTRALQKDPAARFASAREFADELATIEAAHRPAAAALARRSVRKLQLRSRVAVPLIAILIIVAAVSAWWIYRNNNAEKAAATALQEIRRLTAQDNYVKALMVARDAERIIGNRPELQALVNEASTAQAVHTNPPGASVWVRDVALRSDWMLLGTTPLEGARLPQGEQRWRIERTGYITLEFIASAPRFSDPFLLTATGSIPDRMVRIPAGDAGIVLTGYDFNRTIRLGEYLIDKYEITNREFKEFVDAGGYQNRQYWTYPFIRDGRVLTPDEAFAEFHDRTGRPGPSTWEVGAYPSGQDNYPVAGVSWYEAAAYAAFKGRSLPTVYHWLRAAGTGSGQYIVPFSNFSGASVEAGRSLAVGPFGLYDAAGNVKEWCLNEMEPGRSKYILGGGANEPDYMFIYADARSPFDRSPANGFRTARYLKPDSVPDVSTRLIPYRARDYDKEKPVSDEVFRAYSSLYAYDPAPLAASIDRVDDSAPGWRRERVSFAATYGKDRIIANVFLPRTGKPPYQAVVFWPGGTALGMPSSDAPGQIYAIDWLVLSGRAVVYPTLYGSYERRTDRSDTWPDMTHAYTEWVTRQINDARRTADYIESRSDFRRDEIGFLGSSWGGRMGSIVLALDRRYRCAVFLSGGLSPTGAPPEVDPFNFAPHVSVPLLMVNGNQDYIFSVTGGQNPLFRALGTPSQDKRHIVLPGGHGVIFDRRTDVIREALDWFDRYLGPVRPSAEP